MRIHVLTLFPEMFRGSLEASLLGRALRAGKLQVYLYDLRQFTHDRHRTVDDAPFGGGGGMVLRAPPFFEGVEHIRDRITQEKDAQKAGAAPVILFTPQGERLTQAVVSELAKQEDLILLCGHYEGVDERVRAHLATREISIGDYVLTGGELPAMVLVDALARLVPGVVGNLPAVADDSYTSGLLQYPQYTRPAWYRGWEVPQVLLSGDHPRIALWRRRQALLWTLGRRPDLLEQAPLTAEELAFLRAHGYREGHHLDLGREDER